MITTKMTVFTIFGDCWTKKSGGELCNEPEFESAMNNFMLCRLFRMVNSSVAIAAALNKYQTILSKRDFYKLAYEATPKMNRVPFYKFIKKSKKEKSENENDGKMKVDDDGIIII